MDTQFVRDRITQLRLKKGVSEYQMSYDLGHSRSYVYNISSGKSLPPMAEFLQICNYFDITPSQFFDESEENPALLQTAMRSSPWDSKEISLWRRPTIRRQSPIWR